jgi:membrane fusion protein, multidrug efflux system
MTAASVTTPIRAALPVPGLQISRVRLKQAALGLVLLAGVVAAAAYGRYYWTEGRYLVSTDDAYVDAHSALISPKISGYIADVSVDDNEPVKTGQVIARIDPQDYQTALDQARTNVAAAQATVQTIAEQIAQQTLVIEQSRQTVASDEAAVLFSKQDFQRYTALQRTGYGTMQRAQQGRADVVQAQAKLDSDKTGILAAEKQTGVLTAQLAQAKATLAHQQAVVRQAELNLGYTEIRAPFDGTVGARTAQVGQFVQPGTQMMAIVPLRAVYVTANYMETQLTHVHRGQSVTITVDTFPGTVAHGYVESIAPASGQQFALLPPDNATGNFTKIVQRIAVKIAIDEEGPLAGSLRPGMSVEPTIDTNPAHDSPRASLTQAAGEGGVQG